MSWSLNIVGKPADVEAVVALDASIPQAIKDVITLYAGVAAKSAGAIQVKTNGHFDRSGSWNALGEFSIQPVRFAEPAAPPVPRCEVFSGRPV